MLRFSQALGRRCRLLLVVLMVTGCNLITASRDLKQQVIAYNSGQQMVAPVDVQQIVNQALTLAQQVYAPGGASQRPAQQAGTVVVFPNGSPATSAQQQYISQPIYIQQPGQPYIGAWPYWLVVYPLPNTDWPMQPSQPPQPISDPPQPIDQTPQPIAQPPQPIAQPPQPIAQPAPGCTEAAPSDPELQTTLNLHDQFRAIHQVDPLCWTSELQAGAQQWADQCVFQHSGPGENLALYFQSFRDVTQAWYDEVSNYDYASGQFSEATGHFTQVVWKGSTQLGCGYNRSCQLYVCRYAPPGNVLGYFQENVFPPAP